MTFKYLAMAVLATLAVSACSHKGHRHHACGTECSMEKKSCDHCAKKGDAAKGEAPEAAPASTEKTAGEGK